MDNHLTAAQDSAAPEKEIAWGTTPFDNLSREELLLHCKRLYVATEQLACQARGAKHDAESDVAYWHDGLGARAVELSQRAVADALSSGATVDSLALQIESLFGMASSAKIEARAIAAEWQTGLNARALEMGEQALAAARQGYNPDSLANAYFYFAQELLFESPPELTLGLNWHICPDCGAMVGAGAEAAHWTSKPHKEVIGYGNCTGTFRQLTLDDLQPKSTVASALVGQ